MLLAIDIGNSNTKFGIFDRDSLVTKFSTKTNRTTISDDQKNAIGLKLVHTVSTAIICSVVPEINAEFIGFLRERFKIEPILVTNDCDFGLTILYKPLSDAGTDRLVNVFSAVEKYGAPCIVCSFGTALTIDVVDAKRTLIGGLIAPGMNTLTAALKITTSKLPEVEIMLPDSVIQTTTVGSIQSGIVYGYFGLAEKLIASTKMESGIEVKVIATGGFASLIAGNISQIDIVDENLLLDGLRLLSSR